MRSLEAQKFIPRLNFSIDLGDEVETFPIDFMDQLMYLAVLQN